MYSIFYKYSLSLVGDFNLSFKNLKMSLFPHIIHAPFFWNNQNHLIFFRFPQKNIYKNSRVYLGVDNITELILHMTWRVFYFFIKLKIIFLQTLLLYYFIIFHKTTNSSSKEFVRANCCIPWKPNVKFLFYVNVGVLLTRCSFIIKYYNTVSTTVLWFVSSREENL